MTTTETKPTKEIQLWQEPETPEVIGLTITEEDRQNAETFCDNNSCIIATALKRMGFKQIKVTGGRDTFRIGMERYTCLDDYPYPDPVVNYQDYEKVLSPGKPYYIPSVVGLRLHFIRKH